MEDLRSGDEAVSHYSFDMKKKRGCKHGAEDSFFSGDQRSCFYFYSSESCGAASVESEMKHKDLKTGIIRLEHEMEGERQKGLDFSWGGTEWHRRCFSPLRGYKVLFEKISLFAAENAVCACTKCQNMQNNKNKMCSFLKYPHGCGLGLYLRLKISSAPDIFVQPYSQTVRSAVTQTAALGSEPTHGTEKKHRRPQREVRSEPKTGKKNVTDKNKQGR